MAGRSNRGSTNARRAIRGVSLTKVGRGDCQGWGFEKQGNTGVRMRRGGRLGVGIGSGQWRHPPAFTILPPASMRTPLARGVWQKLREIGREGRGGGGGGGARRAAAPPAVNDGSRQTSPVNGTAMRRSLLGVSDHTGEPGSPGLFV